MDTIHALSCFHVFCAVFLHTFALFVCSMQRAKYAIIPIEQWRWMGTFSRKYAIFKVMQKDSIHLDKFDCSCLLRMMWEDEFKWEMKGEREERGRRSLLLRTSVPRLATFSSCNSMRLSLARGRPETVASCSCRQRRNLIFFLPVASHTDQS